MRMQAWRRAGLYFPRWLSVSDASILDDRIDEAGLLALVGNKIVLGEPGIGKSELMRELGRRLAVEPVTAIRFVNARNPAKLVPAGKRLLIDGLDDLYDASFAYSPVETRPKGLQEALSLLYLPHGSRIDPRHLPWRRPALLRIKAMGVLRHRAVTL
jgi:hypothetical protein